MLLSITPSVFRASPIPQKSISNRSLSLPSSTRARWDAASRMRTEGQMNQSVVVVQGLEGEARQLSLQSLDFDVDLLFLVV